MPDSPVFGRIARPEQLNLEPLPFTIIGYAVSDEGREEVRYEFAASGHQPLVSLVDLVTSNGNALAKAIAYLEDALIDDDERARFRDTIAQSDVYIDSGVLDQVAGWLVATYAERPTKPRTGSRSGRQRTGPKSGDAGSGRAGATPEDSPQE